MTKKNNLSNEYGTLFTLNETAKHLRFMGRNKLMKWMRDNHLLLNNNLPSQKMVDLGYMVIRFKKIDKHGVVKKTVPVTLVTFKGLESLRKRLRRELLKKPII